LLTLLGVFALLASACSSQPSNSGTANTEPLVKTEPAKAPSDKGDNVVTAATSRL